MDTRRKSAECFPVTSFRKACKESRGSGSCPASSSDVLEKETSLNNDNLMLKKELHGAKNVSRRMEGKLTKLSMELGAVLIDVQRATKDRNAYRSELNKLRNRVRDLTTCNVKLEMQNTALDSYLHVVKDDLNFYRECYNRYLIGEGQTPIPPRMYDDHPNLAQDRTSSFSARATSPKCNEPDVQRYEQETETSNTT